MGRDDTDSYTKDLLRAIKACDGHATESNIMRRLYPKYNYHATLFFNDAIRELEFAGKVVSMKQGLLKWWEID